MRDKGARLVVLAALAAGAPAVLGCSCMPTSPQKLVDSHALIFAGTVLEVDQQAARATFSVQKLYKGAVSGDRATIAFNNGPGASCGISFRVGEAHAVFAAPRPSDGALWTHLCSMVHYRSAPYRYQPALDAHRLGAKEAKLP
jgi:hypothetical protein